MNFFKIYVLNHRKLLFFLAICCVIFFSIFHLYNLPIKAAIYPLTVCFFVGLIFVIIDYIDKFLSHSKLIKIQKLNASLIGNFPAANTINEADYQKIIEILQQNIQQLKESKETQYAEMIDYYTLWVHQIKTPITSLKLTLENDANNTPTRLQTDVHRIEQYVDMVLAFLRLNSDYSDYIFKEYELDEIVKKCIKKFASDFILRKIQFIYNPSNTTVITDKKWLSVVVEQLISNALKYTPSGSVKVYMAGDTLCVQDTGIGIKPQDIPRVFDKGYTGYNGHQTRHSSGIGLYICKRICQNLKIQIQIQSTYGAGTIVSLKFNQQDENFGNDL